MRKLKEGQMIRKSVLCIGFLTVMYYEASAPADDFGLLFRELGPGFADSWNGGPGFTNIDLPGWDHVALLVPGRPSDINGGVDLGIVWESHPGYDSGQYFDTQLGIFDNRAYRQINHVSGVQNQHTKGTFFHDSTDVISSPVIDGVLVSVDTAAAVSMASKIASVQGAPFHQIHLSNLSVSASPAAQKGADGSFTCSGLIEWAAEQSGYNGGQGFVPNFLENLSVPVLNTGLPGVPAINIDIPTLSPSLLYWFSRFRGQVINADRWIQGVFDPVDFLITDAQGRRFGVVGGTQYDEIPGVLFTGGGDLEQFLIPNPASGDYSVRFFGAGDHVFGGISMQTPTGLESGFGIDQMLSSGEEIQASIAVVPEPPGTVLAMTALIGLMILRNREKEMATSWGHIVQYMYRSC
jgi:hypothetical protein